MVALSCKLFIFFGFYFLHSLSSTNRICRYCVRETIYVEESSAINNNRDITKISLLCNIWCCVATGQRKYQDGRIAWCALPSFLGGETLNGAKTLKVWRIRQSPSFLMINVFHYPWLNRVQANEDSLNLYYCRIKIKRYKHRQRLDKLYFYIKVLTSYKINYFTPWSTHLYRQCIKVVYVGYFLKNA